MITDRYKLFYLIMISTLAPLANTTNEPSLEGISKSSGDSVVPEARALFSPKVDYNEWLPVGRGDPLKNDPTYDYSPPTLDRVRYWGDTNKDKKEILLLGVPSKRQSHKKDTKFNSIRRSYYAQLPTRLMPPPVQTIPPPKSTSNTDYNFYRNVYKNSNDWSYNDVKSDETLNFVSVTRPEDSTKSKFTTSDPQVNFLNTHPSRKPWLHELLQKEATMSTITNYDMQPSKSVYESHSPVLGPFTPDVVYTPTTDNPSSTIFQPTIPPTSMTTDSLFSHYKQPVQPLQGPMYLIIEGHSKVKTYGLKDNETKIAQNQPKIVPVPVIKDVVINHVVAKDEKGKTAEVQHIHKKPDNSSTEGPSPVQSILSFLDTSLGNFFLNEIEVPQNTTKIETKSEVTIEQSEIRESRQIFDYDQLPESELKELDDENQNVTNEPRNAQVSIESEMATAVTT